MTKEEYLKFAQQQLVLVFTTIKAKNADYSGGSDDPFENFKLCERVGLGRAETGLLIRLMDKVQRVKSFLHHGTLQVKNESAADAVRDIIGYSLVLLGMMEDRDRVPTLVKTEKPEIQQPRVDG